MVYSIPLDTAVDLAHFGHDDTSIRAVSRLDTVTREHRLGTPLKTAPATTGDLLLHNDYAGDLWCFAGPRDRGS